ncbi:Abi-alpha family protein [Methylorubrum extorquens]|jgi:hypothetical protein|uniref:Abi-alpha family protein n=1 Tax=Methylorubrum extorquens TaxID=408 RepID=UPI0020A0AC42|nr:Abi-alpha family protein [Methylorubrum extorquens]MCP1540144.1 hypothetical protein [Methylorubrum extorquens]
MSKDESDAASEAINAARDIVTEPSKAVQEVAKTTSKTLDLIRDVGNVFGDAAKELAETVSHRMAYYKFLNANSISQKVEKMRIEHQISPDAVKFLPFGMSLKLLEAASMEEDEDVQDVWARLIFNATNSNLDININKIHIDLIKSLSSSEVILLDLLWECERKAYFNSIQQVRAFNKEMNALAEIKWRKIEYDLRQISVQNLIRLRCLSIRPKPVDMSRTLKQVIIDDRRGSTIFSVEPRVFESMIKDIMENIVMYSGTMHSDNNRPIKLERPLGIVSRGGEIEVPEMNYLLTPLGKGVMRACAKPAQQEAQP